MIRFQKFIAAILAFGEQQISGNVARKVELVKGEETDKLVAFGDSVEGNIGCLGHDGHSISANLQALRKGNQTTTTLVSRPENTLIYAPYT